MTKRPALGPWNRFGMRIKRYRWWLGLVLLIALAASIGHQVVPTPVDASPPPSATQAQDPAVQSVLAYLRAHSGISPAPTPTAQLDGAQQSVMRYVRVHEPAAQPASLWDRLKQTLVGYLRGHGK